MKDVTGWIEALNNEMITDANKHEIGCPADVNTGWCRYFAERVVELVGEDPDLKVMDHVGHGVAHTWVEYRGRAYDSEAPRGVDDWRDLPFVRRNPSMLDTSFGGPTELNL